MHVMRQLTGDYGFGFSRCFHFVFILVLNLNIDFILGLAPSLAPSSRQSNSFPFSAPLSELGVLCPQSNHRSANIVDEYTIDKIPLESLKPTSYPSRWAAEIPKFFVDLRRVWSMTYSLTTLALRWSDCKQVNPVFHESSPPKQ